MVVGLRKRAQHRPTFWLRVPDSDFAGARPERAQYLSWRVPTTPSSRRPERTKLPARTAAGFPFACRLRLSFLEPVANDNAPAPRGRLGASGAGGANKVKVRGGEASICFSIFSVMQPSPPHALPLEVTPASPEKPSATVGLKMLMLSSPKRFPAPAPRIPPSSCASRLAEQELNLVSPLGVARPADNPRAA